MELFGYKKMEHKSIKKDKFFMKIKILVILSLFLFPFSSMAAPGQGIFSWTPQTESLQDADLMPITDVSDTSQSISGSSKKITAGQLKAHIVPGRVYGADWDSDPAGASKDDVHDKFELVATALDGKVDDGQVLTDVPLGAVFTDSQTTITGNAGTATTLATPRAINGVNFDGSAPITINAVDSTAREAVGVAAGLDTDHTNNFTHSLIATALQPAQGKSMLLFGDSITDGSAADGVDVDHDYINWVTYIKPMMGITSSDVANYATGGATYIDRSVTPIDRQISVQVAQAITDNIATPDVVIFFAGTNDVSSAIGDYTTAMGKSTLGSLDKTLLYEALRWSYWTTSQQWPNAKVYIVTPLQRPDYDMTTYAPIYAAIKAMAAEYNFTIIDATLESGIDLTYETTGMVGRWLKDGIHPTEAGYRLVANLISQKISGVPSTAQTTSEMLIQKITDLWSSAGTVLFNIDSGVGTSVGRSLVIFSNNTVRKWSLIKELDDSFTFYDDSASKALLKVTSGGQFTFSSILAVNPTAGVASLSLNPLAAAQQSRVNFQDQWGLKWGLIKDTDNAFLLYDAVGVRSALRAVNNGDLTLWPVGSVVMKSPVDLQENLTVDAADTITDDASDATTWSKVITSANTVLGTAATTAATDYATAAQGGLADSALQPADIGTTAGTVAAGDDSRFTLPSSVDFSGTVGLDFVSTGSTITTFGDSVTGGLSVAEADRYVNILATKLGNTLTNSYISGKELADFSGAVYGTAVTSTNQVFTFLPGFNDMRHSGASAAALESYRKTLSAYVGWLSISDSDKFFGQDTTNISYVGTWNNTTLYAGVTNLTRYSNTLGDTATYSVHGNSIIIGYGAIDAASGGQFSVTIDGVLYGTYNCYDIYDTNADIGYAPYAARIAGLSNTEHEVVITVTSATDVANKVYIDWVSSNGGTIKYNSPNVFIGNTFRMSATGYALGTPLWNNGSDIAVKKYNTTTKSVIDSFSNDGFNVQYVNVDSYIKIPSHLYTDDIHLNIAGQSAVAEAFSTKIDGLDKTVTPTNKLDLVSDGMSPFSISKAQNKPGGYITTAQANQLIFSAGTYYSGTDWIAETATNSAFTVASGTVGFYTTSGDTPGGIATLHRRLTVGLGGDTILSDASTTPLARLDVRNDTGVDKVVSILKGGTTQTNDILKVKDSASADLLTISGIGKLSTDNISSLSTNTPLTLTGNGTRGVVVGSKTPPFTTTGLAVSNDVSGTGYNFAMTLDGTIESTTGHVYAWWMNPTLAPANGFTAIGMAPAATILAPTGETITSAAIVDINTAAKSGTGTITTVYGLKVRDQTIGTYNWASYFQGGNSWHKGNYYFGGTSDSTYKAAISTNGAFSGVTYAATIPTAATDGATVTIDLSAGDSPSVTIAGNRTLAFTNPVAGQWHQLRIIQASTGGPFTITWPTTGLVCSFLDATGVPTATAPALKTAASSESKFVIHTTSSTTAECTGVNL